MLSLDNLLSKTQLTVARQTDWREGKTLRGKKVRVRFRPGMANQGRVFTVKEFGTTRFYVHVNLATGQPGITWTDAIDPQAGNRGLGVVEHLGAAVVLAGIDNVHIDVDYPEGLSTTRFYRHGKVTSLPLLNGTAWPFLQDLLEAGVEQQKALRHWIVPTEMRTIPCGESLFRFMPRKKPGWSINVTIPKSDVPWRKNQSIHAFAGTFPGNVDLGALERAALARPANYGFKDWFAFKALTLGTGRKADFAAIHNPFTGKLLDQLGFYAADEAANHRLMDVIGDTLFFAGNIQADILVIGGDHPDTHQLRQELIREPLV